MKDNAPLWQDNQKVQKLVERKQELSPWVKRILVVDDDPDTTFTFKKMFEEANRIGDNKTSFQVNAYNDPLVALGIRT